MLVACRSAAYARAAETVVRSAAVPREACRGDLRDGAGEAGTWPHPNPENRAPSRACRRTGGEVPPTVQADANPHRGPRHGPARRVDGAHRDVGDAPLSQVTARSDAQPAGRHL